MEARTVLTARCNDAGGLMLEGVHEDGREFFEVLKPHEVVSPYLDFASDERGPCAFGPGARERLDALYANMPDTIDDLRLLAVALADAFGLVLWHEPEGSGGYGIWVGGGAHGDDLTGGGTDEREALLDAIATMRKWVGARG